MLEIGVMVLGTDVPIPELILLAIIYPKEITICKKMLNTYKCTQYVPTCYKIKYMHIYNI